MPYLPQSARGGMLCAPRALLALVLPLPARKAGLDLLELPAVAVWITERGVGLVGATFWVRAWNTPAGQVEHLTDRYAAAGKVLASHIDVGYGQQQALNRARLSGGNTLTEGDRATRVRRGHLDHPETVADRDVGIQTPPEALIETLCPVDISNWQRYDLELHIGGQVGLPHRSIGSYVSAHVDLRRLFAAPDALVRLVVRDSGVPLDGHATCGWRASVPQEARRGPRRTGLMAHEETHMRLPWLDLDLGRGASNLRAGA